MQTGRDIPEIRAFDLQQSLPALRGTYLGVLLHPQGHRAVVHLGDSGAGLQLWSLDPPKLMDSRELPVQSADLPADMPTALHPWAAQFNEGPPPDDKLAVQAIAASKSGDVIVAAAGRQVRTFRLSEDDDRLEQRITLPPVAAPLSRLAVSRDAEQVFCADTEGGLHVLSARDGRELHRLALAPLALVLRFIWGDKLLLVGDELGRVTCWNAATGERHLQFQAHHGGIACADFDTARRLLVTGGHDGVARLWSLEDGSQIGGDIAVRAPVLACRFARQGNFVLCVTDDGWMHVAHSGSGQLIDRFRPPGGAWDVAVSDMRGLVLVVGARGLHTLSADWQRLLDARAQSGVSRRTTTEDSVASSAETPPSVPVTHEKRLGGAPIGAVMPHHDVSGEIRVGSGRGARAGTSEGSQLLRPDAHNVRKPEPFWDTGPAAAAAGDSFFNVAEGPSNEAVFAAEDGGQEVELSLADEVHSVTANEGVGAVKDIAVAGVFDRDRAGRDALKRLQKAEEEEKFPWHVFSFLLIGPILGAALAFGLSSAVAGDTSSGDRISRVEAVHVRAVQAADAALEAVRDEQDERVREFAARSSLASEVERARRQAATHVREAEREHAEAIAEADRQRDAAMGGLAELASEEERAQRMRHARYGGMGGFVFGMFMMFRRLRK